MNNLRSNIVSNFASKAVQALGMLVFTPIYLRILGLEAVGLVGLWMTVRSFLTLLDFGMSTTLNREIAAARANSANVGHLWNTLRTLEAVSWSIALFAGLAFAFLAPWTGRNWLVLTTTHPEVAIVALVLLGCAATFQLPTILYQGGLTGLERQVSMNGVIVACSLVRDAGAIVMLRVLPPTIVTFFGWQALISAIQCIAQRIVLTRALPAPPNRPAVEFALLKNFGKFTAGTGLISLTIMFLGLTDGIVLTKYVPLALYGVFSLSQTAAGAILILVSPLTTAAFPRFVAMVVSDKPARFAEMYHEFAQLIAVAIYPLATILAIFPSAVLFVWTGKVDVADRGRVALTVVALATALNALLYLPLQAQLAARWTKLTLIANAISVVIFVPSIVFLSARFGIEGASFGLLGLMFGQFLIIPTLMHRQLLQGAGVRWYIHDVLLPALPSAAFGFAAYLVLPIPTTRIAIAGTLFSFWLLLIIVTLLSSPLALRRVRSLVWRRSLAV